jgi:predicted XRE-type DNA-binding protein
LAGYQADKLLEALELAHGIWEKTVLADKMEKMGFAAELHRYAVFSLPQLAKIVRLNPRYIYDEFKPNAEKGGRFDPATLNILVRVRRYHVEGKRIPENLIRMGIQGGTSYTCLTALTRISYSKYYDLARKVVISTEGEEKVTARSSVSEQRRANVLALRDKGLTQKEIAHATGLDQPMVSRILRGLR